MSVYFNSGKGWRFDFQLKGKRFSGSGFGTMKEARKAEAQQREAIEQEKQRSSKTDMVFLELLNLRLDHVLAYNSASHYQSYKHIAARWAKNWGELMVSGITQRMVQEHLLARRKVSAYTANKDLRYLRAAFNFGVKKKFTENNPTDGVEFFPVNKPKKYVPPLEDIELVLSAAAPKVRDYLIVVFETLARVGEVNALVWDDVDFGKRIVTLYTRKKRGGNRTPRSVFMTGRLFDVLSRMHAGRDASKPWVFWGKSWDRAEKRFVEGPYGYRQDLLVELCQKAGVRHFSFHALRHAGASLMDSLNIPIGTIQRILGHENRTTTEIYLHSVGQAMKEAFEMFGRARVDSPASPTPSPTPNALRSQEAVIQ